MCFLLVSGLTWVCLPGRCRILRKKKRLQSFETYTDTASHLPSSGGQSNTLTFKNGEMDSTPCLESLAAKGHGSGVGIIVTIFLND